MTMHGYGRFLWTIYWGILCAIGFTSCVDSKTDRIIPLREQLYAIVDAAPGIVGVAFISDTDTVTINNGVHYPMMSVFKLHQALAVADKTGAKGTSIDSMIHVSKDELDVETWSPMLKIYGVADFDISIRDLIKYSLTASDNNASNILFNRVVSPSATDAFIRSVAKDSNFRIVYSEAEMKNNHALAYLNYSTPLSAASLMSQVFDSTFTHVTAVDSIRKDLTTVTTGHDRLGAIILEHPELCFAHKTGSGYRSEAGELIAHNDVGFFRLPDGRTYALAVFVRDFNGSEADASQIIAGVSQKVYDYMTDVAR